VSRDRTPVAQIQMDAHAETARGANQFYRFGKRRAIGE
jgi:hypothetical protein